MNDTTGANEAHPSENDLPLLDPKADFTAMLHAVSQVRLSPINVTERVRDLVEKAFREAV